ncbi:MerR family DNA-binding transcriptional regulator [Dankookia rubra]|uniref:MerR family DNA-binding transcriptional regulator n=1 Tax=Dankookia rubra TaxID=1442381 RepID=A0A4R5Q7U0_9PROT|nr:MerR family DNA-binding transcriptional regulator [Dankookia rubra]TDH58643.1 MerR family DNA-binding transcriptional regulator [Dankookia rubra]
MSELFTVNQLAEEFGVTPRAIRFYEVKGLIAPRRAGTTRVFDRRDRARLLLVLRGKRLGFSLAEIREFLDLYDADHTQHSQINLLLARVRQRIAELEQQRRDLDQTLGELRLVESEAAAAMAGRPAAETEAETSGAERAAE